MYAVIGNRTREPFTFAGKVILHTNRAEMEFLFPFNKVVETKVAPEYGMLLEDHPDMTAVRFPLRKEDFRDQGIRN